MGNWKNDFKEWKDKAVLCGLSCCLEGKDWITKWDGAVESEIEATKGGLLSDSMQRAAFQWGICRYLKKIGNIWVEITPPR
ncbi:hypothetical protein [Desulfosporosinus sp. HMP52]|uniref:hypothetical protein n=1 Tax=Desulfosporosinus sp. HMP52 TaxID=1487923 RepID=UPI000689FB94|nr:hypothetical protein [Desulfosporosinus sp. HMP52]